MKSILFATTALVATAGVASAEIALSGMAEMGIFDNGNDDTQFFTDIDVTFTMSGEADNGLTFGASIDLDESDGNPSGAFSGGTQGGEAIFISYGGATLTMGDTDGALDARTPELALAGGSINDDETTHLGFNHSDGIDPGADGIYDPVEDGIGLSLDGFGDGQIARFDYAYDAFTFSLSAEQVADGADVDGVGNTIWGLGVSYSGQVSTVDLTVGLGYQTLEDFADVTTVAVTGGFANGFSAGLTYTDMSLDDDFATDDIEHWGIGFGYEMNALALGLNYGEYDAGGTGDLSGWGFAALYDLGGGLEARFGYGYSDVDADALDDDYDTYSLGLRMNF